MQDRLIKVALLAIVAIVGNGMAFLLVNIVIYDRISLVPPLLSGKKMKSRTNHRSGLFLISYDVA